MGMKNVMVVSTSIDEDSYDVNSDRKSKDVKGPKIEIFNIVENKINLADLV